MGAGQQITYSLILSNSSGIADSVLVTVELPSNVSLITGSVTPPTSTVLSTVKTANASSTEATQLAWQFATLETNGAFEASFAVMVDETAPMLVQAQASAANASPQSAQAAHAASPTSSEESEEPTLSKRLFLPLVTNR